MKNLLYDVAESDGDCLSNAGDPWLNFGYEDSLNATKPTVLAKPTFLFLVVTAEEKEQVIAVFDNVVSAAAFSGTLYERCILHRTRMMKIGEDYLKYVVSPPVFPKVYDLEPPTETVVP